MAPPDRAALRVADDPDPADVPPLHFVAETNLPTHRGTLRVRAYRDADGTEPLAIVHGDVAGLEGVAVRVHDECFTSEVLGSQKCDCREQLDFALDHVRRRGGVVIYLRQEGRGIGLANKIAAYALQERGADTVDANRLLGLPDDSRRYEAAAAILRDLGVRSIRLMTNNPRKVAKLAELGVRIDGRIPVLVDAAPQARGYLQTKADRMGHVLRTGELDPDDAT